jgi:hypothetical protein
MTYKWEAIAQDLTEERDRLLKENERLRGALQLIVAGAEGSPTHGSLAMIARAALKSEKQ